MRFKDFVILMGMMTAVAWIAWGVVLFSIDPTKAGSLGFFLFYLTLVISLIGTLTLVGTGARFVLQKDELLSRLVVRSFRHSILLSFLLVASIILLSWQLFTWWLMFLFIMVLALVELIFISLKGSGRRVVQQEDSEEDN